MSEQLLTYVDVGRKLKLSRTAVHYLVKNGELPEPLRIGRARRFREADVNAYVRRLADAENAPQSGDVAPRGAAGATDGRNSAGA